MASHDRLFWFEFIEPKGTVAAFESALSRLIRGLPPRLEEALKAHLRAPDFTLTLSEISKAAHWKFNPSGGPVNSQYGRLARPVCESVGLSERPIVRAQMNQSGEITRTRRTNFHVRDNWIRGIAAFSRAANEEWQWTLFPEVVLAFQNLGFVPTENHLREDRLPRWALGQLGFEELRKPQAEPTSGQSPKSEIAQPQQSGGTDWTQGELSAIVSEYFAMLAKETSGTAYSKTDHRNKLLDIVYRTKGSIERKHQNISAILHELGLPWISGYKPLGNYQNALVDAVEMQLGEHAEELESKPPNIAAEEIHPESVFVDAPSRIGSASTSEPIARVARNFDPAKRDAQNRKLGEAGEAYVGALERKRLAAAGRSDLAAKVVWASKTLGDGLGYDIESFDSDGTPIFVEVKTTRGPMHTPFFLTENERSVAAERKSSYRLYRLFNFGFHPQIYELPGPIEDSATLAPIAYRVSRQRQKL